jgi:hypothetical protein
LDFVKNPVEYKHSSAKFYSRGEQGVYLIKRPITTGSRVLLHTRLGVETRQGKENIYKWIDKC